jgi:hypothetical protein
MKHSSLLGYIHIVLLYLKGIEPGIANVKFQRAIYEWKMNQIEISGTNILSPNCKSHASAKEFLDEFLKKTTVTSLLLDKHICLHLCIFQTRIYIVLK